MLKEKMTQEDLDRLADIIWWIKGYIAGARDNAEDCPFSSAHAESLRRAKVNLQEEINKFEFENLSGDDQDELVRQGYRP